MSRILVLGGYGVFGRRAAERLARHAGLEIIVAGRSASAAKAAAAEIQRASPSRLDHAALDATTLSAEDLVRLRVGVVVNTVGPFQVHDYRVARAAIGARAHYVDIADARGFVAGIGALDAEARTAGVLVVSGASSVPAVAAAVVDRHRGRFATLSDLVYGIAPGNSFDPGLATTRSMLSGAGRPILTLREGRMGTAHGWQPLIRRRFRDRRIGTRLFGHVDVPDLDLFPARYPSLIAQDFLAGTEVKAFHAALWALSWLVRAGLVRRTDRLAGAMLWLKGRLGFLGSDKGAMFVDLSGHDAGGRALTLSWELVADRGHGPYIPVVPAVILARRLAEGRLDARGAVPCLGLVTIEDFFAEVTDLAITATECEASALYPRVLGVAFGRLPATVRRLHELAGQSTWRGEADVALGPSLLARIAARLARLPRSGPAQPLTVAFRSEHGAEDWRRCFGASVFPSRQWAEGGRIAERVGPAVLLLAPEATADGLTLTLAGMRILGLPVPRRLLPVVATRESEADGRYRFEVDCRLPWGAHLVRYSGTLEELPRTRATP